MANKGGAERLRGARRDRTEKLALINKGGEREGDWTREMILKETWNKGHSGLGGT